MSNQQRAISSCSRGLKRMQDRQEQYVVLKPSWLKSVQVKIAV